MSADGISIQTTLVQAGNVAKTQLKGQQTNQQTTAFSEQVEQSKDLKVQRVKKSEKTEKKKIDPDEEKQRGKSAQEHAGGAEQDPERDDEAEEPGDSDGSEQVQGVGRHIDTLA